MKAFISYTENLKIIENSSKIMPKTNILNSLVSSKKIVSRTVQNNSRQSKSVVDDDRDSILYELKLKNRPIIWSFGLPTRVIVDVRKKYSSKLATLLGFKFINLDEQILKWIEQYKEDIKIKQFKEMCRFSLVSGYNKKVRIEVSKRMDQLTFKLKEESVTLKIVPTRSARLSESTEKKMMCNNGTTLEINDYHRDFQAFHIVEQLSRKKAIELLKFTMYDNLPATGFIIDGFPKDKIDVEFFERLFYRAAGAIYWAHSESTLREEEFAAFCIRDYEQRMNPCSENLINAYEIESELLHSNKNSKVVFTDPEVQKANEARKTNSNAGRKLKIYTSVEQRCLQSSEWEIRQNQSFVDRRKSKTLKRVTIVDEFETESERRFWKDSEGCDGFSKDSRKRFEDFSFRKQCFQNAKQMYPKAKACTEFPKYAMRHGQYTHEENEGVISIYGNKAIKLEEADFLKVHPKVADILISTVKDLLSSILSKTKYKIGKHRKQSFAAFSNHSINFSAAGFHYKPFYPGPNSELPLNFLSNVQRVIHPLLVHHERTTEPTIISVHQLIDAAFNEIQSTFLRQNVIKPEVNIKRKSPAKIHNRKENVISGEKLMIRGRRQLSREMNFTDNTMSFNLQKVQKLTSANDGGNTINSEYPASESSSVTNTNTIILKHQSKIPKNKSVLELELEIEQSDVFIFNSEISLEQDESLHHISPISTQKPSKENLSARNTIGRNNSIKNNFSKENKNEGNTKTNPKEINKQEHILRKPKMIVDNNQNVQRDDNSKFDISLIHDSVFCPTRYERNNNVIVEVAIENNLGDGNLLHESEGADENDDEYLFDELDSLSIQNLIQESKSYSGFNINKNIPTQGYVPRKRFCENSRSIENDRDRQYERLHNWATPYFDTSFKNYKSFNSTKRRQNSRFWNILEFERYIEQEHLDAISHDQDDDNSFDDHTYTDAWRSNWIAAVSPHPGKNISFLKRMCDCLCLCLKKYNDN